MAPHAQCMRLHMWPTNYPCNARLQNTCLAQRTHLSIIYTLSTSYKLRIYTYTYVYDRKPVDTFILVIKWNPDKSYRIQMEELQMSDDGDWLSDELGRGRKYFNRLAWLSWRNKRLSAKRDKRLSARRDKIEVVSEERQEIVSDPGKAPDPNDIVLITFNDLWRRFWCRNLFHDLLST